MPAPDGSSARLLAARDGLSAHTVVTSRTGGVSRPPYDSLDLGDHVGDDPRAVAENRARLAARVGVPVAYMGQVHGAGVAVIDGAGDGPVPDVDALVTATPALALAVLVADCVPVLLADARAGVAAAVHAGRRGVQAGVVHTAWEQMQALGARAEHTRARLGVSVCGRCYEVPPPLQEEVAAAAEAPRSRTTTYRGTTGLDLRVAVMQQLRAHGVHRVQVDPGCTREDRRWFSHRRDGVTGRFAGVVWLEPW